MGFEEQVRQHIQQRLQVDFLLDEIRYGLLRDIVEECFLLDSDWITLEDQAKVILSALFGALVRGFDFGAFIAALPKSVQTAFLTTLLFQIYYLNLTLEHLLTPESLHYYLLRTLALDADGNIVAHGYSSLSFCQRLSCLGFCLKNFDEGSYRIIKYAMEHDEPDVQKLLNLAERKVVSTARVAAWMQKYKELTPADLQIFLQRLEATTTKAVEAIQTHFPCTEAEVRSFAAIFGLYDHQVPKEEWDLHLHEYPSLEDKLAHCTQNSAFKEAVHEHIHALHHDPGAYKQGVELITYALPTAGKDLSLHAWLPSIAAALDGFCKTLNIVNAYPIFVFDQSGPLLFSKNAAFCRTVSKNCIHLDTAAVLAIARRLQIDKLLNTGANGHFGYGGARNTIFLLMPLLRYYLKRSTQDELVSYVMSLSEEQLKDDFRRVVLDETEAPCVVHMGDDDVHVPFSTVFSDALFAYKHKDEYFCRFGWQKGRKTTWTETSFNLEYLLDRSQDVLLQHNWQEEPFRHGMAGLLSKPKLCLNVPFGQEEAYLLAMNEYLFDLRQPMLHLSGYRFPKAQIPTNRFVGLAAFLKSHYSYSVGSMLVSDLLDPLNLYKRCSLPWNMVKKNFKSLRDAIEHIIAPRVIAEMQKAFIKNMVNLEKGLQEYEKHKLEDSDLALFHISVLEIQDVDTILEKYSRFGNEVAELKALFIDLAEDAKSFKLVLGGSKIRYPQDKFPITHSLELLRDVVTHATFQKILSGIVKH